MNMTIKTTAGTIPVKLRLIRVEESSAQGLIFLPKTVDGQATFSDDRKHTFEVEFQRDGSELRYTGVRITGKKKLDLLVLEAMKDDLTKLIEGHLKEEE